MKEKEWKKEQKIPLLPVEFPEDSVMQKDTQLFLNSSSRSFISSLHGAVIRTSVMQSPQHKIMPAGKRYPPA